MMGRVPVSSVGAICPDASGHVCQIAYLAWSSSCVIGRPSPRARGGTQFGDDVTGSLNAKLQKILDEGSCRRRKRHSDAVS